MNSLKLLKLVEIIKDGQFGEYVCPNGKSIMFGNGQIEADVNVMKACDLQAMIQFLPGTINQ